MRTASDKTKERNTFKDFMIHFPHLELLLLLPAYGNAKQIAVFVRVLPKDRCVSP